MRPTAETGFVSALTFTPSWASKASVMNSRSRTLSSIMRTLANFVMEPQHGCHPQNESNVFGGSPAISKASRNRKPKTPLPAGTSLVPLEHSFQLYAEDLGDAESRFQRGGVFARFDRRHGLACHADLFGKLGLRHLVVLEAQAADLVGDGQFRHGSGPAPEHDDLRDRHRQRCDHHRQ